MKVLEEKPTYSGTAYCGQCECKLEYEDKDVVRNMTFVLGPPYTYRYVICPKCGWHISIEQ